MTPSNKFWRRFLRVGAGLVLVSQVISVVVSKIKGDPVYLDKNDGYLIIGSIALILSIEAIKRAIDYYVKKKSNNN